MVMGGVFMGVVFALPILGIVGAVAVMFVMAVLGVMALCLAVGIVLRATGGQIKKDPGFVQTNGGFVRACRGLGVASALAGGLSLLESLVFLVGLFQLESGVVGVLGQVMLAGAALCLALCLAMGIVFLSLGARLRRDPATEQRHRVMNALCWVLGVLNTAVGAVAIALVVVAVLRGLT